MCDYCDCRSHPEIAALSDDHERLGELLGRLTRAVADDDRAAAELVGGELHALLGTHADREERGVFVQLRLADVGDGYVALFEDDHKLVHALLDQCQGPGWKQAAGDLARVLGDHILREETDLFPAAHQLLTPRQWDAVAASRYATTQPA